MTHSLTARAAAETVLRDAYGRLVALLAARCYDIAAAEDALGDAFAAALDHWPRTGVPRSPEAWLLTAARRKLVDASRRRATHASAQSEILRTMDEFSERLSNAANDDEIPDERLKLLFICAHPAIDPSIRTPLMLQTVLGLDAQKIARAFLVAPATMSQRLVRAKRKIAEAGIPFETPDPQDLDDRLAAVAQAIYAAFTVGYDDQALDGAPLAEEAIYLGDLVAKLAPEFAEGRGVLALMLYAHARRAARYRDGRYVPLSEQETEKWDNAMIAHAERMLLAAAKLGAPHRFQIEAAIQSAHVAARLHDVDTRDAVLSLYDQLLKIAPTAGAIVGKAAAQIGAGAAKDALATLEDINPALAERYQPYWATRAKALAEIDAEQDADAAYERAIDLSTDPAARRHLIAERARLREGGINTQ